MSYRVAAQRLRSIITATERAAGFACPESRLLDAVEALESGEERRVAGALRRLCPEYRKPIEQLLEGES